MFENETMFSRTEMLVGQDALKKLKSAHVLLFGLGGVGGITAEMLCRSGVGNLTLVDNDVVSNSNLNRQIFALHSTLGKKKVLAAKERLRDINPQCNVSARDIFFLPENKNEFNFSDYDYVIDAIDTVSAKVAIIEKAKSANVPVISSMGTGNKLHGERFRIADIFETSVCPLARVMRNELRKRNIQNVKVLFSDEKPLRQTHVQADQANTSLLLCTVTEQSSNKALNETATKRTQKKQVPASISFVPNLAGLLIAGEVVRDLLSMEL